LHTYVQSSIVMYMKVIGPTEFRKRIREYLDLVIQGEEVIIERAGVRFKVAMILPRKKL